MVCQKCNSKRIAYISGICADRCYFRTGEIEIDNYVPKEVGQGDFIKFYYCLDCGQIQSKFYYCLDCGQIQSKFPIPQSELDNLDF